jgi:hypothetical protein
MRASPKPQLHETTNMSIKIPEGLEVPKEAVESGVFEAFCAFSVNEDGTLTLTSIEDVAVGEPPTEEGAGVKSEEETIGDFVRGQLASQGME